MKTEVGWATRWQQYAASASFVVNPLSTMAFECCVNVWWVCTRAWHVRRTLTLTYTITAYSVSRNVVRVRILICATRQKPCRKRVYRVLFCSQIKKQHAEKTCTHMRSRRRSRGEYNRLPPPGRHLLPVWITNKNNKTKTTKRAPTETTLHCQWYFRSKQIIYVLVIILFSKNNFWGPILFSFSGRLSPQSRVHNNLKPLSL